MTTQSSLNTAPSLLDSSLGIHNNEPNILFPENTAPSGFTGLSNCKKALLVGLVVLAALSMLLMLGTLIFLLATGGSVCTASSVVSLTFFVSLGVFIVSAVSLMGLQSVILAGLKPSPKPDQENSLPINS